MLYGRCKLPTGKTLFQGSAGWKSLDQWESVLAHMMTILTSGEGKKFIVIASGVSSIQHGKVAAFVIFPFYFLNIVHSPTMSTNVDGWWLKQRGVVQESSFWGLDDEKFFQGCYSPKSFEAHPPKSSYVVTQKKNLPELRSNGSHSETWVDYYMLDQLWMMKNFTVSYRVVRAIHEWYYKKLKFLLRKTR
jgi:hypothetical protein